MPNERLAHVVEDDQAMRDSLAMLLDEARYKVRAYAAAEDLLAVGAAIEPGCVISDVRMPGMDGLALLQHLRVNGLAVPVILITGYGDIPMAVTAMKAGAIDFLEKPFKSNSLLTAVETAFRFRAGNADAEDAEAAWRRVEKLTSREHEVLDHLAAGRSNNEVAAKLGISPRSVELYRAHIIEKTEAKSLPDLVRLWLATRPSARPNIPDDRARPAASWQVRRVEEYIEANWDKPITIEELAHKTGVGVRNIFITFGKARGRTPMAFLRSVRLQHARRMLQAPNEQTSVTAVGLTCGFHNAGHFARYYRQAFNELPSTTLYNAKGTSRWQKT